MLRSAPSICLSNMNYSFIVLKKIVTSGGKEKGWEGGEEKGIVQLQSFQNGLNWDMG